MLTLDVNSLIEQLRGEERSTAQLAAAFEADSAELFEFLFRSGRSLGISGQPTEGGDVMWRLDRWPYDTNRPPVDPDVAFKILSRISATSP